MNQRPILFSTPMVQAILAGRKTQTRRIIKSRHESGAFAVSKNKAGQVTGIQSLGWDEENVEKDVTCPCGFTGDVLYVRETWKYHGRPDNVSGFKYAYKANIPPTIRAKWKPSIHMPKAAARIWLRITNVRVERLQEISEEDAKAEGVQSDRVGNYLDYTDVTCRFNNARNSFRSLWQSINGAQSWEENPWVWCITFERIEKPEA